MKQMSVEELFNQPVVSASRQPESWNRVASNLFLIRGQAEQSIGATLLPDLLRTSSNLFVAQKTSSEWAINSRGFVRTNASSNKLLVMIDGRTIYSPLFSNVFWEANSVFLPDLERIEVISGPAGSTWGGNAVNGVINIQSKTAHDTLGGLVFATAGSAEKTFGARYGTELGATGAMRVYVQGGERASTWSPTGVDDDFDHWRSTQAGFRSDWGDSNAGEFTVQGDAFAGRYANGTGAQTTNDEANLLARWSRDLSPDSQLWIRAYHDYTRRNTQDFMIEISRTTDLEFQHQLKLTGNQDLLWGANYRFMQDSITKTVGFAILPTQLDFYIGSLFAQHQINLFSDRFRLTTGFRLEHNHFSGWESQPSLRLARNFSKQVFWVSASRATRVPSRLDSGFFAPATPPYIVVGGPNFKAEVLLAYELGWRSQLTKDLSVTATAYFHDYDHLRSVEPAPTTVIPFTLQNKVAGRSHGLELFADWDINAWWRLRAGGFVMHQETWIKPGGADNEGAMGEASFPQYQAQLRNTFRFGEDVTLWTNLRRVDEVPAYVDGTGVVPAYTELDASLRWIVNTSWEVSLSGNNLLAPSHPEIGGGKTSREIPRTVQTSVRFKF